jgi:transcriptional regulator with XRE-family HTH domain
MNTLKEFVEENRALYQQEELLLEVTELLASVMEDNRISKAELARRIGKSKAFVTQCLSGSQNLTLRTLSDLFLALGYRLQTGAVPTSQYVYSKMIRLYPVGAWSIERCAVESEDGDQSKTDRLCSSGSTQIGEAA